MCNITREKFIIFYRDRIAPTHFVFIPYVIIIVDNEKKNMCRYKKYQGNRIKICNFAQVVAYMCYLKMHKTIFSLCFSCHYNF